MKVGLKTPLETLLSERPSVSDKLIKMGFGLVPTSKRAGMPDASELKAMARAVGAEWKDGYELRVVPYIVSTEVVDSYGDIVKQDWLFDRFEKNPVMPLSHDWYSGKAVAIALRWVVEQVNVDGYSGPALTCLALFPDAETNEQSDSVLRMVNAGLIRGVSPGFWPGEIINPNDSEERAKLGLGAWGVILAKNMLAEISPCAIPANPVALVDLATAKSKSNLNAGDVSVLRECMRSSFRVIGQQKRDANEFSRWEEADEMLVRSARLLYPSARFERRQNIDQHFEVGEDPARVKVSVPSLKNEDAGHAEQLRAEVGALSSMVQESFLGLQAMIEDLSDKVDRVVDLMGDDEDETKSTSKLESSDEKVVDEESSRGARAPRQVRAAGSAVKDATARLGRVLRKLERNKVDSQEAAS